MKRTPSLCVVTVISIILSGCAAFEKTYVDALGGACGTDFNIIGCPLFLVVSPVLFLGEAVDPGARMQSELNRSLGPALGEATSAVNNAVYATGQIDANTYARQQDLLRTQSLLANKGRTGCYLGNDGDHVDIEISRSERGRHYDELGCVIIYSSGDISEAFNRCEEDMTVFFWEGNNPDPDHPRNSAVDAQGCSIVPHTDYPDGWSHVSCFRGDLYRPHEEACLRIAD